MLGCYDFCGHYDWTFEWLEREGGVALLHRYWDEAIHSDSQRHAVEAIQKRGFEGMADYWGHTLAEESPDAGYTMTFRPEVARLEMHDCPSRGFLIRNGISFSKDYCDHCMGWIQPTLEGAGFAVDHTHNHCGQCWWEIRRKEDSTPPSKPGEVSGEKDIRLNPLWQQEGAVFHDFRRDRPGKPIDPQPQDPA
jgi:hypothetical protein